MLPHRRRKNSTKPVPGLFCCLILATSFAGCADTPRRGGLPWWPQGPGVVSEDVLPTGSVAVTTDADIPKLPSTRGTNKSAQAVRYGDLLFVSGQIADDQSSLPIAASDIQ